MRRIMLLLMVAALMGALLVASASASFGAAAATACSQGQPAPVGFPFKKTNKKETIIFLPCAAAAAPDIIFNIHVDNPASSDSPPSSDSPVSILNNGVPIPVSSAPPVP